MYAAKCQACHGEKAAGKPNDQLVGGFDTIKSAKPAVKTVGSYWPYAATCSIMSAAPCRSTIQVVDLRRSLRSVGIYFEPQRHHWRDIMNSQSLPKVQMPHFNRDRFIPFPSSMEEGAVLIVN